MRRTPYYIGLIVIVVAAGIIATRGSSIRGASPATRVATATLKDAQGRTVGTAQITEQGPMLGLRVQVTGLPAGQHGIHLHATGVCAAPDFTSAGGHVNPANREHGLANPSGPHAGDLPNLPVAANGAGQLVTLTDRVTFDQLFDDDGAAVVIHAKPDDQQTSPAGNSGARIACGVLSAAIPQ
jgi:Cu-Zn family superoxide dismutase